MPVAPTYPGVYVEEVPSGVHPISGVPTAIGGFIGWFPKGRLNRAVEVVSFADVEREYGGLHRDSDTSFALQQFFLNGGARAWVVRVAAPGTGPGALGRASVAVPAATGTAFTLRALDEGAWGNDLRAQVVGPDRDNRFDLIVSLVGTDGGRAAVLQQETFRGLTCTATADPNYLPTALNGVSRLVTVDTTPALATPRGSGARSAPLAFPLATSLPYSVRVTLGGVTGVDVTLPGTAAPQSAEEVAALLQSAIRTAQGSVPAWAQATVFAYRGADSGTTQRFHVQVVSGVGDKETVAVANGAAGTHAATLGFTGAGSSSAAGAVTFAGGGDGLHPGATEIVGSEAAGTGMFALENTDFTLMCLPSIANQLASDADGLSGGTGYATIVGNAITYCRRKRAMLLLDPPNTVANPSGMKTWIGANSAVRDEYAALYYPRVTIADPTRNYQARSIGPSGTIAGLMARVDAARGVWKAPAGTEATLRGLQQLGYDMTDGENGILNPIAINCLREFDAYGMVSWGARTLDGSDASTSEYRYVPVRRLANFLESSLMIGLKWVVFEPNDEPLWSQIRLNVGSFLHGLFRQGAFAGRTPRDAYLVKCDATTTTTTDQALGVVNILVGFAPLRPAEFVVLRIQQLAGQTQS